MQQDLIKESYECGGRGSYATAGHTLRLNDSTRPPPPPPPRIWRHNRSKSESRCLFYFYVYSMCVCVFFAWCKASSSHTHARRGNRGGNEREAEQLPPPPVPLDRPYRERESPYCAASTMADIGMHNWSRNNNKERKKKKLYLLICAPIRPSDGRERENGGKKKKYQSRIQLGEMAACRERARRKVKDTMAIARRSNETKWAVENGKMDGRAAMADGSGTTTN